MRARHLLMAGLLAVSLVGSAQACFLRGKSKCCHANACCAPAAGCCGGAAACGSGCCNAAPCAPAMVNCIEWVQEQRQVCCTVRKMEQRQVTCTGYRCEHYTEPCTRTVCCKRYVTEQVMECRTVCERVPVMTQKTIMKERCVTQTCTEMHTKVVDHGHWECKEVPCGPSIGERAGSLLGGLCKKKHHDCCDSCNSCNSCCETSCCPKTKTVKCWVPCKECVQCPVTVCKKVKVCEPCTVNVCCYQTVTKQIQVPCCKTRCITEQKCETYNVCKTRMVPYTYCKTVCVCVPCQETRTITVCVPHCVQKPASPCCNSCCR
jgi:hypothetical protein